MLPDHRCDPGWRWSPDGRYGSPPARYEFPDGSTWLCRCGRGWVAVPRRDTLGALGVVLFRPERLWERLSRSRRSRREVRA